MTESPIDQEVVDRKNAEFWNEMCGSQLARRLGVVDNSPASLKKLDDWYFDFYPYLFTHVPFGEMAGKAVLEVGLGYGTVAQKLAASCGQYHGLDIAAGPVGMAVHRCNLVGAINADVRQGSILAPPFADGSFDWIVAIGCLHHTGNLPKAINAVHQLLKPGGQAVIMVYSAASYRQFATAPLATIRRKLRGRRMIYSPPVVAERERSAYDTNLEGAAAPQTEFVTKAELAGICRAFRTVQITAENIGGESVLRFVSRPTLCKWFGPTLGLDLYCRLTKRSH